MKQNKTITLIITLLFAGCSRGNQSTITGQEGKPLPSFSILLMDSTTYINTENAPKGNPIIVLFFNPNCPYCRADTRAMLKNINSFKDVHLYFLSSFTFSTIKEYYEYFHLKNYPNITVGQDYKAYFVNYYKVTKVPYLAIFSRDKKLSQVLLGNIDIEQLKGIAHKISQEN